MLLHKNNDYEKDCYHLKNHENIENHIPKIFIILNFVFNFRV